MNFNIELVLASGGRLGRVTQIAHGRTVSLETPMCSLFTKGGSVPYLSLSMLERVKQVPELTTMSLNSFVEHVDSIRDSGKKLADFTSMKNKLIFSSLHDASLSLMSGKNDKSGVAVWGKGGKTMLDPDLYMKIQESLQPDWIMALSDGDTDQDSTEKRCGKAVDRTLDFLDEIVSAQEKSEVLKSSSLIGVVVGGFSERHRERSARETSLRPVDGFLLEGFQKGNAEENLLEDESFRKILSKTLSHLPETKLRIIEAPWSPLQVIQAFKQGIDLFSSAYPHTLAEKGLAMTEDFSLPPPSTPTKTEAVEKEQSDTSYPNGSTIDLNSKRFFEDFDPVLDGCQCYTCTTFSRSYVHHLLNTSELLAHVLLTIHNFERYFLFFHSLRDTIKAHRLEELEQQLLKQYKAKEN